VASRGGATVRVPSARFVDARFVDGVGEACAMRRGDGGVAWDALHIDGGDEEDEENDDADDDTRRARVDDDDHDDDAEADGARDDSGFVCVDARDVDDAVRDFVERCVYEYVVLAKSGETCELATPERVRAFAKRVAGETRLTTSRRRWRAMKRWTRRVVRAARALNHVCDRLTDPWMRRVVVLGACASGRAALGAAYWMLW
jgi:hypothetical protein